MTRAKDILSLLLFLFFPSTSRPFTLTLNPNVPISLTSLHLTNGNDTSFIGGNDDGVIPYKNRTLAWTRRYRSLVPYESARLTAMRLGLGSKEEWEDIREFGKAFHGAHLVSRPDIMYAKEWISWDEFLGVMRSYEEVKEMIQSLGLKSMEEYIAYVMEDVKRAESLRIPAKPEIYYRDRGWKGEDAFFDGQ